MSSNFNNTTPAAPANCTNVAWQTDGSGNDSANVPTPFLLETDVVITSLLAGDVLIWSGSEWVNGLTPTSGPVEVNPQTMSYVAVLGDANQLVTIADSSASTFTVPTNGSVAFPVGTTLSVIQLGTGQITLTPASGAVTIDTPSSLTTRARYSTVSVVQVSANVWVAGGDLT